MGPDLHLGKRTLEHPDLRFDLLRHAERDGLDLRRDVLVDEQMRQVGIDAAAIQVNQLRPAHRNACVAEDVDLKREVGKVVRLGAGGGLHFAGGPPEVVPHQKVDLGICGSGGERALVDGGGPGGEGVAGGGQAVVDLVAGQVDERAARCFPPGGTPHLHSLIHQVLRPGAALELRRLGVMHFPPEPLVALASGQETGLREPDYRAGPFR